MMPWRPGVILERLECNLFLTKPLVQFGFCQWTPTSLIEQIRDHLKGYGVPGWPARLDEWVRELDQLEPGKLEAHLLRTRRSLGGMGSISDIVICPEAGYNIPNNESAIKTANDTLLELVGKLDAEVTRKLAMLPS